MQRFQRDGKKRLEKCLSSIQIEYTQIGTRVRACDSI